MKELKRREKERQMLSHPQTGAECDETSSLRDQEQDPAWVYRCSVYKTTSNPKNATSAEYRFTVSELRKSVSVAVFHNVFACITHVL